MIIAGEFNSGLGLSRNGTGDPRRCDDQVFALHGAELEDAAAQAMHSWATEQFLDALRTSGTYFGTSRADIFEDGPHRYGKRSFNFGLKMLGATWIRMSTTEVQHQQSVRPHAT